MPPPIVLIRRRRPGFSESCASWRLPLDGERASRRPRGIRSLVSSGYVLSRSDRQFPAAARRRAAVHVAFTHRDKCAADRELHQGRPESEGSGRTCGRLWPRPCFFETSNLKGDPCSRNPLARSAILPTTLTGTR